MEERKTYRSNMARSTKKQIVVKGFDLTEELMGGLDLGEMTYLLLKDEKPDKDQGEMINAILVTLVEHGITPSALATRLTYLGEPESVQGAVASGLLGVGSQFVGTTEDTARILQQGLKRVSEQRSMVDVARELVQNHRREGKKIPGIGHPVHDPDPRTVRLFELAKEKGLAAEHVEFMRVIQQVAEEHLDRRLPINATGAISAVLSDMNFSWKIIRGFSVIGRCVGLVGNIQEEMKRPMARTLWDETEKQTQAPEED